MQQLLQPLPVLLARHQIGRAFHDHNLRRVLSREYPLLIKLLHGTHQAVVFAAFPLQPPRNFRPHIFQCPPAKILVDKSCRSVQVSLWQIEPQYPIAHYARFCDHNRQHLLVAQP